MFDIWADSSHEFEGMLHSSDNENENYIIMMARVVVSLMVLWSSSLVTVIATAFTPEQVLALHLALETINHWSGQINQDAHLETCDVSVAEVLAQLLHLLQLQQMDPQHLDGDYHQVIHLFVASEERFLVSLLMLQYLKSKHILYL